MPIGVTFGQVKASLRERKYHALEARQNSIQEATAESVTIFDSRAQRKSHAIPYDTDKRMAMIRDCAFLFSVGIVFEPLRWALRLPKGGFWWNV